MSVIPTNEPQIKDFEPFDYGIWGALVRKHRKEMGYNAEQFTEFLELATRIKIHPQTYYKIEQGKQTPSHAQYMGVNLAVFDDVEPPQNVKQMCLSKEWQYITKTLKEVNECGASKELWEDDLVPHEWACKNSEYAKQKLDQEILGGVYDEMSEPVTDVKTCSELLNVPMVYFDEDYFNPSTTH